MKITVIIATYNRCESLKNTLYSLLNQKCNGTFDYEVIVVDNNSKDKTKEVVESFKGQFNGGLRYVFEPRQGKSYALNTGLEKANGEIVTFTDDDCIVDKNWLRNIKYIFKNKQIDLLTGRVYPFFRSDIPKWLNIKTIYGPLVNFNMGDKYIENCDKKIFAPGANTSIKKISYYKFGGFIETLRGQDTEFCNRWDKLGARIAYDPSIVVYHYTNPLRLNKNYFRKWYFLLGENKAIIFKERFIPKSHFLPFPLWLCIGLLSDLFIFLRELLIGNNAFLKELMIWEKMGIICSLSGIKIAFENLR